MSMQTLRTTTIDGLTVALHEHRDTETGAVTGYQVRGYCPARDRDTASPVFPVALGDSESNALARALDEYATYCYVIGAFDGARWVRVADEAKAEALALDATDPNPVGLNGPRMARRPHPVAAAAVAAIDGLKGRKRADALRTMLTEHLTDRATTEEVRDAIRDLHFATRIHNDLCAVLDDVDEAIFLAERAVRRAAA